MTYTGVKGGLRGTRATVDLKAIEHNVAAIRGLIGGNTEILAVVKADAYGHGAVEVARACEHAGATMLGVALVEEGVELRDAGIELPILVQCCVGETEIEAALCNDLLLTVTSRRFAEKLSEEASRVGITATAHADIDTGMGRIGFAPDTAVEEIAGVARLPNIDLEGVYTHLAKSEVENDAFTLGQLDLFDKLVGGLKEQGIHPEKIHAANSGAVINYPRSHLSLVRAGLILYGVYPHPDLRKSVDLEPALKFESSIIFLKDIQAGTSLGYGRSFVAPEPVRIATANVGYADGYPWRLSNGAKAIVRGKLVPVVGRVSMDQLLIDVSSVPDVKLGDAVVLLGEDGEEHITAEDLAEWAGTIPYEILCGISKRVPRQYKGKST